MKPSEVRTGRRQECMITYSLLCLIALVSFGYSLSIETNYQQQRNWHSIERAPST